MGSTLCIDALIEGYFRHEVYKYDKYTELRRAIVHCDFQDTDADNETECYFYFSNKTPTDKLEEYGKQLHEILGIDYNYKWMVENQTEEGNPEYRIEIICHIEI